MIWVRKGVVWLLSFLLLITLLGAAFSTSFNRTLGQPEKVQKYLAESRIYDHFIDYIADLSSRPEGDEQPDTSDSVSLSDAAVLKAAQSSFPPELIQKNVNTFIDANYAWLEGKTAKPEFRIDLTEAKETFAQKAGRIVKGYTANLPACKSAAETAKQRNVDPLEATCRPKDVTPAQAGAQTTERLSTTGDFLSDPVITSESVNPNGNKGKEPYYENLSQLPQAYQLNKKMPFILAFFSVLLALGIVFIAVSRRRGLRRLGFVLAVAGAVLVAFKFTSDFVVDKVAKQVFNNDVVGQLQRSLTDFVHRVQSSMTMTDMLFGIAFLVLAAIILISLFATRDKTPKPPKDHGADGGTDVPAGRMPLLKARKRLMRPFGDSIMPLGARPGGVEPEEPKTPQTEPEKPSEGSQEGQKPGEQPQPPADKPKRRKKPRLIQ
ncbi:MAG TPA: hypothetical protein VFX84_01060 [Candidatus Saccharimonadales bacterium]|nr:hypothetical protein [Candidatus Saccharimonadales bacterium]